LEVPKDGLLDSKGSSANEVRSSTIEQANQCCGSLSQMKWCPYALVMVVTTNTTVFQRPPFTNTLKTTYHIAGKFGRDKVWQIYLFQAFGKKKFGE